MNKDQILLEKEAEVSRKGFLLSLKAYSVHPYIITVFFPYSLKGYIIGH